jgi:hypothetical protein
MRPDIVRRYGHNPILTKAENPCPVETVHNAAVVKHGTKMSSEFASQRTSTSRRSLSIVERRSSTSDSGAARRVYCATTIEPSSR